MDFLIADTFTDSLNKLTADEQKIAKMTAFDLQMNPAHPSMQLHRLGKVKDNRFWSARVNRDIRLIVHRTAKSFLLCYVAHQDEAYNWAERRKLERHPKTGAAQIVEIRKTIKDVIIPNYVEQPVIKAELPLLFADTAEEDLLSYGVPPEWLEDVKQANEDTLLNLAEHLPDEAAEALLDLAIGAIPQVSQPLAASENPFTHPDAQRRFRVMNDVDELKRALEFPWEKWTVFLHPAQRALVERDFFGPARVAGSAGTGKTIVALHRAVFLAKSSDEARVLLTTFSESLANALDKKLRILISNQPRLKERIDVYSLDAIAKRLYKLRYETPNLANTADIAEILENFETSEFNKNFLLKEWLYVVDAWQLDSWEAYKNVRRLGRRKQLAETKRQALWNIFEQVHAILAQKEQLTLAMLYGKLSELYTAEKAPFNFVVLDEAQDVSVAQLRFLAALAKKQPNSLFFAGDLGQRIFQAPFSWKSLGIDVRGRSHTLRINYRTSHQIRMQADRLLDAEISDVDGIIETRNETISIFNGPVPNLSGFATQAAEIEAVSEWLKQQIEQGISPAEIGVFVRSDAEIERAKKALEQAQIPFGILSKEYQLPENHAALSTMHYAKGLEFRSVIIMACDDEVIPSQTRMETISNEKELDEVYNTERHLLYVACTRARDNLFVSGVEPISEFIDDLQA